jgi:membrane-associated phospholipid phosphatase
VNNKLVFLLILTIGFKTYCQTFSSNYYIKTVETAGDIFEYALPVTALGVTILNKDWEGTKQFAFAAGTNYAATRLLKFIIRKKRPGYSESFEAFPSGHTSSSFVSATFIQRRYGWKYGKYAFLVAAFVGYSRVESNNHDFLDVIGGAVLGVSSAYIFTVPLQSKGLEIGFSSNHDHKIISLSWTF